MDRCPMCRSPAFVLFTSVECTKPGCIYYAPPRPQQEGADGAPAALAERAPTARDARSAAAASFDAWARRYRVA